MRRERAEAAVVGVLLISFVGFLAFGVVIAIATGVMWLLS